MPPKTPLSPAFAQLRKVTKLEANPASKAELSSARKLMQDVIGPGKTSDQMLAELFVYGLLLNHRTKQHSEALEELGAGLEQVKAQLDRIEQAIGSLAGAVQKLEKRPSASMGDQFNPKVSAAMAKAFADRMREVQAETLFATIGKKAGGKSVMEMLEQIQRSLGKKPA